MLKAGISFFPSIATIAVVSAIILIIITFFRLMNIRARKYLFYDKEATFYEGFLSIMERTVPYEKITDFVFYRSVWDRLAGTGTIRLVTAGHGYGASGRGFGGGTMMQYLPDAEENYRRLEAIIKKNKLK
jgi:uncharacterized membrane protein YdbT with pleckstrin-like domain